MFRSAALVSVMALMAAAARATDCLPLAGVGCYFIPDDMTEDAALLIYLRGHHPTYGPNVPAGECMTSAQQAFAAYELGKIAREKRIAVLVTYRSGLGVTASDLEALAFQSRRTFSKTVLASLAADTSAWGGRSIPA